MPRGREDQQLHSTANPRSSAQDDVTQLRQDMCYRKLLAYEQLAEIAPTLREREWRVLQLFTKEWGGLEHQSGRLTLDEIAEKASLSRSNVILALRELDDKRLIGKRLGTGQKSNGYGLTFTRAVSISRLRGVLSQDPSQEVGVPAKGTPTQMGGPPRGPGRTKARGPNPGPLADPEVLIQDLWGPELGPSIDAVVLIQDSSGPNPGLLINKERACAGASIDSISTSIEDRSHAREGEPVEIPPEADDLFSLVRKANPKHCNPDEMASLRRWVHGYQRDFGREKKANPPDDKILAELLAVASSSQIIRVVQDLMAERKEAGYSYAWFLPVVIQRIYGISPEIWSTRRAALRAVYKPRIQSLKGEQTGLEFAADIAAQVQTAAKRLK